MTERERPLARLWFSRAAGEWIAWDADGKQLARGKYKQSVTRACEDRGYRVIEV